MMEENNKRGEGEGERQENQQRILEEGVMVWLAEEEL